mgnify:CR=1 FL=1|jgi:VanZ family protein
MTVPTLLRRLSPLLVMALIHAFSSLPGTPHGGGPVAAIPSWLHNLAHVPAYALLAASWHVALGAPRGRRGALLIGLLTVGYGVLDEWHQSFVPGRQCSAGDVLRDALGAAVGIWAMRSFAALKMARSTARPAARDQ